jgi:trehalose-6-phosphate synthase
MVVRSPYGNNSADIGELCEQVVGNKRLIVVSNRGPIEHRTDDGDGIRVWHGGGGVAVALSAAACHAPVAWVASAMTEADRQVVQQSGDNVVGGDSDQLP